MKGLEPLDRFKGKVLQVGGGYLVKPVMATVPMEEAKQLKLGRWIKWRDGNTFKVGKVIAINGTTVTIIPQEGSRKQRRAKRAQER
jgi:hypothetical protein